LLLIWKSTYEMLKLKDELYKNYLSASDIWQKVHADSERLLDDCRRSKSYGMIDEVLIRK
jgi:hypothetical protein